MPYQGQLEYYSKYIKKYLDITSDGSCKTNFIYVGTVSGYPHDIQVKGKLLPGDFIYHDAIFYDSIFVKWSNLHITCRNEEMYLPTCANIPLFCKYKNKQFAKHYVS